MYLRWLLSHCNGRARPYRQKPYGLQCEHMVTFNETWEMRSAWRSKKEWLCSSVKNFCSKIKATCLGARHRSPQCLNRPGYHILMPIKDPWNILLQDLWLWRTHFAKHWLPYFVLVLWLSGLLYFWLLLHLHIADIPLPQCLKNSSKPMTLNHLTLYPIHFLIISNGDNYSWYVLLTCITALSNVLQGGKHVSSVL